MNKTEWLKMFNENKEDLFRIIFMFSGATKQQWENALVSNDPQKIGAILQRTWENAPDKPWIRELEGWFVLCDLCSEYVFGDLSV